MTNLAGTLRVHVVHVSLPSEPTALPHRLPGGKSAPGCNERSIPVVVHDISLGRVPGVGVAKWRQDDHRGAERATGQPQGILQLRPHLG